METRGIRNKNPFNIKRSANHWHGKLSRPTDKVFEQFTSIKYGVRAGILLLRNGYINKGLNKVEDIVNKYAPSNENIVERYCSFIYQNSSLTPKTVIVYDSFSFFELCRCICFYESKFVLDYDFFLDICRTFKLK